MSISTAIVSTGLEIATSITATGNTSITSNSSATVVVTGVNITSTSVISTVLQTGLIGDKGADGYTPIKGVDYFDGIDGTNGVNGVNGYTPIKGVDYVDGVNGADGYTPVKGVDYIDGAKGNSGTNGTNGIDGYTPIKGVDYFDGAKGDNGANGTNGTNGADGYTPVKGIDYVDGVNGTNGTNGVDGYTPVKGADYFDGTNGTNGINGTNGTDGADGEAGTTDYTLLSNTPTLDPLTLAESNPTTPSAGNVTLFRRDVAGRQMAAIIGPSGLDTPLQPSLAHNKVAIWSPSGNGTGITLVGCAAMTATGTATTSNVAVTSIHTRMKKVEFLVTTAATTAVAGFRLAAAQWTIGATTAGLGGFHYVFRWATATGQTVTTTRCFVGMANTTAAPTDVEPSTITNIVGMGWDSTDSNVQIMYRGTGTINKIDLGTDFPIVRIDRGASYEIAMFSPPGTTQVLGLRITNLGTGAQYSTSLTTNLPTTATLLAPRGWMSVGGTSSVIGCSLISGYIESDY